MATEGELQIADCITTHVTGKLTAWFASGLRIDAEIDTEAGAAGRRLGSGSGSN